MTYVYTRVNQTADRAMRQLKIVPQITIRDSHALDQYLSEISRIPVLTPEQEVELAQRIQRGDEEAVAQLVKSNLRFVVSVAKQYQNFGLPLIDLINEGNLGLIKAARRFDPTRGFKFISYAVWWIRQAILQAIVDNARLVRLPGSKISLYSTINKAYLQFLQEHQREPTVQELSEMLQLRESTVHDILQKFKKPYSMDQPIDREEGDVTFADLISKKESDTMPDEALLKESFRDEMHLMLNILNPIERQVICRAYGLCGYHTHSVEEIAHALELSEERVRQYRRKALRKLRVYLRRNNPF